MRISLIDSFFLSLQHVGPHVPSDDDVVEPTEHGYYLEVLGSEWY